MRARRRLYAFLALGVLIVLAWECGPGRRYAEEDPGSVRAELRKPHTPEEVRDILQPDRLPSIGETAEIAGLEPQPVIGLSLVTGLGDRGSQKRNVAREVVSAVRKNLMREEGREIEETRNMMEGLDSSIVEVHGQVPAGTAVGDRFDVAVRPLDSAVSLDGGRLHRTSLRRVLVRDQSSVAGDVVAMAEGRVAAGAAQDKQIISTSGSPRVGLVFDGGTYEAERVLFVRLKERYASGRRAVLIEYLINKRFQRVGLAPGASSVNYATALTSRTVRLRIPPPYRGRTRRFADVVRALEGRFLYGQPPASRLAELARALEEGDPEEKYEASVALEAVGEPAVEYLRQAGGDGWTRLYSGVALAYLNRPEGRQRVIDACESDIEQVRYQAVSFLKNLSGRSVIQALRAKVFDESGRISIEAVRGLIEHGEENARLVRLAGFDLVALRGTEEGLIVKSYGRPMIVVASIGVPLVGDVELNVADIGIGSLGENQVGIVTGSGRGAETVSVEATVDNVLAAVVQADPSFEEVRKVVAALEDAGHLPYEVAWLE